MAQCPILLDVKDEPDGAEDHLVAWTEPRGIDLASVHLHPVGRPEVDDLPVTGRATAQLRVAERDVRVVEHAVALARAPETGNRAVEDVAPVVERDDRLGLGQVGGGGAALAGLGVLGRHRVDHRVTLLALLGRLALARRRLHQARLDPELAEPQALVGLEPDLGPGQQRVVVAARMLEQVCRQLLLERALVALEAFAVLGGEPDRVLVGNVDARHRGGPVSVHLLRQLARDLDRLHLRREGAAEHPFDEVLYPLLKVA